MTSKKEGRMNVRGGGDVKAKAHSEGWGSALANSAASNVPRPSPCLFFSQGNAFLKRVLFYAGKPLYFYS